MQLKFLKVLIIKVPGMPTQEFSGNASKSSSVKGASENLILVLVDELMNLLLD